MINIYIIRHGQTETNLERLVCGQMDTVMTELGHQQVKSSVNKVSDIPFHYFYTSPLIRAIETAKHFNSIENFEICPDLMEMNTGDYSHLHVDELWNKEPKLKYQGRYQYQVYPNGESLALLYHRISTWFKNHLMQNWKIEENILIVGHEATVVCAIHHFLQIPLENYPSFKISNGCIVRIICDQIDNQFRVEFL